MPVINALPRFLPITSRRGYANERFLTLTFADYYRSNAQSSPENPDDSAGVSIGAEILLEYRYCNVFAYT